MSAVFLISDYHFGHANILTFRRSDGSLLRPGFDNVEQMNEFMVEETNKVVRPQDHLYIGGDVAMRDKDIEWVGKLNGKKRLVLGNHDFSKMKLYAPYFEKIFGTRRLDNFILSHYPIHPDSIGKARGCIYGHVHDPANNIKDPRYFSICVENLNYTPISIEEVASRIEKQKEQ